jgi:hypothetical protein
MDIHTDMSPVISLTSPTIFIVSKVIPLAWKISQVTSNGFYLNAERKVDTHNETWQLHANLTPPSPVLGRRQMFVALQVSTSMMDPIVTGQPCGWSCVITNTGTKTLDAAKLELVYTDEFAEAEVSQVFVELCRLQKERRDALEVAVPNG